MLDYRVKCTKSVGIQTCYEASIPNRQIFWQGETEREAIRAMLTGVAELARDGAMDPDDPDKPGVAALGPVQTCMKLLAAELQRTLDIRASEIGSLSEHSDSPSYGPREFSSSMQSLGERIGNTATAIAALSRVKAC